MRSRTLVVLAFTIAMLAACLRPVPAPAAAAAEAPAPARGRPASARPVAPAPKPRVVLGIFGGMGPEATADCYRKVIAATPATKDQDHIPTLIYSLPQVPDRTTAIRTGDRSIVPWLVEGVTRLERAGASFIIIPCNTAHYYFDDMQAAVRIPIVNMIRETVAETARRHPGARRIGLLATSGTIATHLYEREFAARGIRTLVPDSVMQEDVVMKAIGSIKAGEEKRIAEDLLAGAADSLVARGAEVLVLGCTETPLAFNPTRARAPVVDATRVLAQAAVAKYRELSARVGAR
jgi:aspartate racemase